jgi:hypothetical protein
VPYFSRFQAVDWIGLNNKKPCGKEAMTIDEVWQYIESENPDVVYSFLPPASPGINEKEKDPAFLSSSVQRTLSGRGSQLFFHWNRERLAEMFYREMLWVRDNCVFGGAYNMNGDWMLMAYLRRDSSHFETIGNILDGSSRPDRVRAMDGFYNSNPRLLGRE